MSAPIDTKLWAKIKAAYMADTSQTNGSVAKRFKVSKSAVDKRSAAEGWKAQREAQSIAVDAIASEVSEELSKPIPAKSVRVALQEMDRNEIFDAAIAQLHAAAPDAGIKSQEAAYPSSMTLGRGKIQILLLYLYRYITHVLIHNLDEPAKTYS
jgi:hypothetical protein